MKPLCVINALIERCNNMAKAIKLSDSLANDAVINGKAQHRSAPKQIEYWASIGKIADKNPDLPLNSAD